MDDKYKCHIDLSDHLDIDDFDTVLKALEAVVQGSESLSLDSYEDRDELLKRLEAALGVPVKRKFDE